MAAPAAALLAIMNLQQNNQQGAGSSRSMRGTGPNNLQAGTSGNSDKKSIMPQKYLTDCRSFYSCLSCRAHLANHDELISRSFQGNRSRAYLFNSVINITTGAPVQRELNTGSHAVADIFCSNCGTTVGWKYEKAYVDSQKYKEGKFIIELAHVVRENRHLELDKRDMFLALHLGPQAHHEADTSKPPTIGQLHQGSLSPLSNSAESRWSSGMSSASSQVGDPVTTRYSEPIALYEYDEQDDDDDDDDEQEVLMFPFHDDLYGERASYSNLSISRLSYRRRNRRSLHLDSTPYDWKYLTRSAAPSSLGPSCSSAATDQQPTASSRSLPGVGPTRQQLSESSNQQPESSLQSGAISNATQQGQSSVPLTTSKKNQPVNESSSDEDYDHQHGGHDENEIQFKLDPCCSSTLSDNETCDRTRTNKRKRLEPSSSSTSDCQPGQSSVVKARESYDEVEMVLQPQPSSSAAINPSVIESDSSASGCLSIDDEEFYDCCTGEHHVSSS